MRSDEQIIEETNDLARYLCAELVGTGYQVPADHKFYEAADPRSKKAWGHAVKIMEMTTKTEMADVLATLQEEPDTSPQPHVEGTFDGAIDTDTPLQAAAREAGWALSEIVDSLPWSKRGHVSEIIGRLTAALLGANGTDFGGVTSNELAELEPMHPDFPDSLAASISQKSGYPFAVIETCPTCEGTGKEGRHSICRVCDETPSPAPTEGRT